MGEQYRRVPIRPIASGRNDAQNPVLLADGETPDDLNTDYDRGSVASAGGSSKFNNQTAPRPGLLVGTPANGATLPILPGLSVPVRGSLFIPYSEGQDVIGADYTEDISTFGAPVAPKNRSFARQRGKDFDLQVSFRIPRTERLYPANTVGALNNAGSSPIGQTRFGADEALDEFFAVAQKGGDRMTPMSWALGAVNTGALFDIDVGGGLNIFGVATSLYAKRVSNYALCFMWFDAPCTGVDRPLCARYNLSNGSVVMTEAAAAVTGFPTFAYRAMIVPFFVEPGANYSVALRLTKDTGTSGTAWTAATGTLTGISWNANGAIDWRVQREYDAIQSFVSTNGAGSQVLRYKGPADTLEYFCKYGVRYHGRDAMHLGLGFRYSAWTAGGFIPFGIDSCPVENGGFQITDHSVHGSFPSLYQEWFIPEQEHTGFNSVYQTLSLQFEYDTTDGTGTKFGINHQGFVGIAGAAGQNWGNQSAQWANIDAVMGKNPWSPHDLPWAGLGGLLGTGFNTEALKSYRLVFANDSLGNTSDAIAGSMISIGTYVPANVGSAGYTFNQHVVAEGGDQLAAHVDMNTAANRRLCVVRAFRWNQRPVVVSDFRLYSRPRTWDVVADFSLGHELDLTRSGEPGIGDLRGHWPLTDGGGQECSESILGNAGFFSPMAGQRTKAGGVFLSGEGEALYLNLCENPDFRDQLRAAHTNGKCGVAIQISMIMPEAQYALSQRMNNEIGGFGASSIYRSKFAPPIAVWDFDTPDRASDTQATEGVVVSTNQFDHVGGNLSRPLPLLEFGHNIFVENAVGLEPFSYPMGFSLRAPVRNPAIAQIGTGADFNDADAAVPGTGAAGLHTWFNTGTNASRWDKLAGWAGKEIIVQFGLEPTVTEGVYRPYIAAWPKEFLNPVANDPAGAEFAYYVSSVAVTRRQIERSVVVIGGAWNPKLQEFRSSGGTPTFITWGRAAQECNSRMIVKDVRVFGTAPAGALPAASGSAVALGTGKIIGGNALAITPLTREDLLIPVAAGGTPINFTSGSRTATSTGSSFISQAEPHNSKFAVLRSFLAILGDRARFPVPNTESEDWPRTYYVAAVSASDLTLNRPVIGPSRRASGARCFRVLGYTSFDDDETIPLTVGKGRGYDTGSVTIRDAQVTQPAFENRSPIEAPWRWRVYSSLPSGSSLALIPTWVRGCKRSTWNRIRGLHGVGETLYAGAQASLFEADDRWRAGGPTEVLQKSFAVRAEISPEPRFPLEADRVVFTDASRLQLGSTFAVEGSAFLAVFDAWVKADDIGGLQTILWCGRLDTNGSLSAGAHGIQFWTRLSDGFPEFVLGAAVAGPPRGLYIARGARRLTAGEWTHVRWGVLGVTGGTPYLMAPVLWVGGKRVAVSLNAADSGVTAGGWVRQSQVQYDSAYQVILGAARDALASSEVTRTFTAVAFATQAPILPSVYHGFMHAFGGEFAGVACARETNGSAGFDTTRDFDPRQIAYGTRRFSVLETSLASYGIGHKMLDTVAPQFGTIFSHPLISITHAMGGGDAQWSFANSEADVFCANGGRVGVIDSKDNSFRYAGLRGPQSLPKVEILRAPLWKANKFVPAGDPDNDPIYAVEGDIAAGPTYPTMATPGAILQNYHYNNPGTKVLVQTASASMTWLKDSFFAFKCFIRMSSVTGRINIFSMRTSLGNGGPFLEIRDGYLYAGWYDTTLKQEVSIRTSIPVIEPGFVYYLYYRKWFPRGGLASVGGVHTARFTKSDSNWANSIFVTNLAAGMNNQMCFDSLIFRRVPRSAPSGFNGYTGWDLKSVVQDTDATAGFGGGLNYDYPANGSSARACISATAADSEPNFDPYLQFLTPTGMVMEQAAIHGVLAQRGDNAGRIQISTVPQFKFVLDHVGMLMELRDPSLVYDKRVFRIVEFISFSSVKVIDVDGSVPQFGTVPLAAGVLVSVYMGVSLVKSDNYDKSTAPDVDSYSVELFGSALQANQLNGVQPFKGEAWSFAYGIFPGQTADAGGNVVGLPNIFEDVTAVNCPAAPAAASELACAVEAGTDMFGLQGSLFAVPAGALPFSGTPLGELEVDTPGTFSHTSVDCTPYYDRDATVGGYAGVAAIPRSTKPSSAHTVANAGSAGGTLLWTDITNVPVGMRLARVLFYDRFRGRLSAPGEPFSINVPAEDVANPSASVELLFTLLPACPDGAGFSTRIYMTPAASTVFFEVAQIDDDAPDSIAITIDIVTASLGEVLDVTQLGVPPDAAFVAASQGRMCYANLPGQADGVAFSLPALHETVPVDNVFPANTGKNGITALVDFKKALVVFKRDAIIPVYFDSTTGLPLGPQTINADGCVSSGSIAALEDRIYYVSDRGPMVLLDGFQPFYVGNRLQTYFTDTIDKASLGKIVGAINRQRNQYVFTVKAAARTRMDQRFSLEFQHPTAGADFERAEMAGGHRAGLYEGPACTALGTVEPRGGGPEILVGGTDQGFVVWMDRQDHRMALSGPVIVAGATPLFGSRTLTVGATALAGTFDRTLEGHMGQVLRAYQAGEQQSYVLFTANDGQERVYLEGPLQEAIAWLTSKGVVAGAIVSLAAMLWRWSTKAFDCGTIDLDKRFYFLDASRKPSGGTIYLDPFRNGETTPRASLAVDLAVDYTALEVGSIIQEARVARFLFRSQTPAVDIDVEIFDLVMRLADNDPR